MKKFKYIFFDWGYTLIRNFKNTDNEINQILSKYNLNWKDIFNIWKNYQILLSLSKINEQKLYDEISKITNISSVDLELINNILCESHILDNKTKKLLIDLFNQGYYLGIISNGSIKNIYQILERENIKKYFSKIMISEMVKERKPNLKIYLEAFKDINEKDYNKILFVSDELIEDLLGVKILNVKTVLFKSEINNEWKKQEYETNIKPDYVINSIDEIIKIIRNI